MVEWEKTESVWKSQSSAWRLVTSGVLRGSVLGPVLFLIFVSDLDKFMCSSVLKFADGTKLFSGLDISGDRDLLHQFTGIFSHLIGSLTKLS